MKKVPVMAWYFPSYHPDERNDVWHGKGWTEWEESKRAFPRFPGHEQPKHPLWGHEDESDPKVMEKKIDTAVKYGIDGFVWDMYWDEVGPYRMNGLMKGFFGAANNTKMKIAMNWCNHDLIYVHPAPYRNVARQLSPGQVTPQAFFNMTDFMIKNVLNRENYLRVDGKLYFAIWDLMMFINGMGGEDGARIILQDFRRRVKEAGLGELYLAIQHGMLASANGFDREKVNAIVKNVGIDGGLRYGWPTPLVEETWPKTEWELFEEKGIETWEADTALFDMPISITASLGWDSSPRTVQSDMYDNIGYPYCPIVVGGSPEKFEKVLRKQKAFAESDKFTGPFVTLTTWNEWTEGNYLEPSEELGYAYLETVKKVWVDEQ